MCTRFFLLGFFFFAFLNLSGQIDGVHLNMRLHPVQILSIGADSNGGHKQTADQRYISVSSTTGFEVSMYRRVNEYSPQNVINSSRGTVHKDFAVNYNAGKLNRETYADSAVKSDDFVLTLISR